MELERGEKKKNPRKCVVRMICSAAVSDCGMWAPGCRRSRAPQRGWCPFWLSGARSELMSQLGDISSLFKQLDWKQEPGLLFHLFPPFFFPSLLPCPSQPAGQGQVTFWRVLGLAVRVTCALLLPLRCASCADARHLLRASPCGWRPSGTALSRAKPGRVLLGRDQPSSRPGLHWQRHGPTPVMLH